MFNSPQILVIDDDKNNLNFIAHSLKDLATIIVSTSGEDGLNRALSIMPDIILLDILMPGLDGFDVISKVKNLPALSSIPVLFITGVSDSKSEEKGLLLGASDYIHKPIQAPILRAKIKLHLKMYRQQRQLEQLASIDGLTGIPNRRNFDEKLALHWQQHLVNNTPISIAILDIDHFKQFNDCYGHLKGDRALEEIAQLFNSALFDHEGLFARYGGEEFGLILLNHNYELAQDKLKTLVDKLNSKNIQHAASPSGDRLSVSIGGVSLIPSPEDNHIQALAMADDMLYQAKNAGRNQVCWKNLIEA